MKIVRKHTRTGLLTSVILLSMNSANANNAEDRYIYIGTELGISEPVVKSFVDKDTDAKFRLKQSTMVGGRIGYSFYPNMMIELSATYQPKYGLTYLLPVKSTGINIPGIGAIDIPETPGRTKVSSNVYTANFIYEFSPVYAQVKPYVILGAGIARLSIKPTTTTTPALAILGFSNKFEFFRIKKNTINCLAWQIGGGIGRDLSENISMDIGAKLQVVNDIKVKYDTFDIKTQSFVAQKPIKKTIGVGEFTLGFTFKIPV
jgi:opacity protein-like surface antigen